MTRKKVNIDEKPNKSNFIIEFGNYQVNVIKLLQLLLYLGGYIGIGCYLFFNISFLRDKLPEFLTHEIRIVDELKPVALYNDMEVSNIQFTKIYAQKNKLMYRPEVVIEYTFSIKNNGPSIIKSDDPNGNNPILFDELLVLTNLDGIKGKEFVVNFGETESSDIGEKVYSTLNPILQGDSFNGVGKIVIDKSSFIDYFNGRSFKSLLYIKFTGTTNERYKDDSGYGLVIKEKSYEVDLNSFLSKNKFEIE